MKNAVFREDAGNMFLRNVSSHKIYTAPHPRRQHSSINVKVHSCYRGSEVLAVMNITFTVSWNVTLMYFGTQIPTVWKNMLTPCLGWKPTLKLVAAGSSETMICIYHLHDIIEQGGLQVMI
jgi:hypothetical protein